MLQESSSRIGDMLFKVMMGGGMFFDVFYVSRRCAHRRLHLRRHSRIIPVLFVVHVVYIVVFVYYYYLKLNLPEMLSVGGLCR